MNPRYGLFKRSKLCALIIRVIFLETIVGGASTVPENGYLQTETGCMDNINKYVNRQYNKNMNMFAYQEYFLG